MTALLSLALLAAPLPLDVAATKTARLRFQTGQKLCAAGDFSGAARELRVALALAPHSPRLTWVAARCVERSG